MNDCSDAAEGFCQVTGHIWLAFKVWDGSTWQEARCCRRCGWHNLLRYGEWIGVNIRRLATVGQYHHPD